MKKVIVIISIICANLIGCTEPFDFTTEVASTTTIDELLVVEATLTNELKQQEVLLGKGRTFANDSVQSVMQNAQVQVVDSQGNSYQFFEIEPGRYLSQTAFQAFVGVEYQLKITTPNGTAYESKATTLPPMAAIASIYSERIINDVGIEGVAIYADADLLAAEAPLFRYEYEETFKIIAPLWSPFDMVVTDPNPPYAFDLVPREQEERVCYNTITANRIIQTDGLEFSGNSINKILVRFISRDDYIISHRYSILVKQLTQNPDAFSYYRTLNEQSSTESVFTGIQPGFIESNIVNIANNEEKVLGYFEVASASVQRLFFNYEDLFPDEDLPPYAINCSFLSAPPTITEADTSPLKDIIESGDFIYVSDTNGTVDGGGPYFVARRPCGDCTAIGSNMVPDFWVD